MLPIRLIWTKPVLCVPSLVFEKLPETLGSLRSVSACSPCARYNYTYCEKKVISHSALLNPVFIQAAVPFYTFSKNSGLPCIPKQIASQLDNSTQTIDRTPEAMRFVSHLSLNNIQPQVPVEKKLLLVPKRRGHKPHGFRAAIYQNNSKWAGPCV